MTTKFRSMVLCWLALMGSICHATVGSADTVEAAVSRLVLPAGGASSGLPGLATAYAPDIRPYTPSGWSYPLVTSAYSSSRTHTSSFKDTDTIYVSCAMIYENGYSSVSFKSALYVDGVLKTTISTTSLQPGDYAYVGGYSIGTLSAGTHTIKLVADCDDWVSESYESNNTYTKTITVTGSKPDLRPYTPSGWSYPLVASAYSSSRTHTSTFLDTDTIYVSWAATYENATWSASFTSALYIDGVQKTTWNTTSLQPGEYTYVGGYSIGKLSAGTHTIKIVIDSGYAISESNESNNTYSWTITVTSPKPDLRPYTPSGWSYPLVTSAYSSSRTHASTFLDTDTIYVSWAVIYENATWSATFTSALYIDGVQKTTWNTTSLQPGYYSHVDGYSIGKLSAGTHTVKIVFDSGYAISESNEGNNTYSWTITVKETAKPYTVVFHKNDGSGETRSQTFTIGKSQHLPWLKSELGWESDYASEGLHFKGWATYSTATYTTYENGQSVYNLTTAGGTYHLYAVLAANVSFKANGGSGSKGSVEVISGTSYTLPPCPFTRPDYKFDGWNVTSCCSWFNNPVAAGTQITVYEDTVLWAHWTYVPPTPKTYTVVFHKNDGSGKTATQVFTVGKSQCLNWVNSQLGWSDVGFEGWAKTPTGPVVYKNGQSVKDIASAGATLDLYAIWKAKTYTVRFNKNDGSGKTATQVFTVGKSQCLNWVNSQLNWPESGFLGWAKTPTGPVEYKNGQSVKDIASAGATLDLYLVWQPKTFTVVLHRNFSATDTVTREMEYSCGVGKCLLWMDSQIGWRLQGDVFLGWSKDKMSAVATYSNGQKVTDSDLGLSGSTVHLYAIWKANQVKFAAMALQIGGTAESCSLTPGLYRGEFADGSGTFDLLLDEDGSAFFRAETEDGDWAGECEVTEAGETLLLTFEDQAYVLSEGASKVERIR